MNRFNVEDIIRFINREMDETERTDFEAELEQDSQLKADYELYIKINGALKAHKHRNDIDDLAFKENLRRLKWDYFSNQEETPVRKLRINKFYYVAAAILMALFIWAPWNQNSYNEFFDAKMVSVEERGSGDNISLLKDATEAFNKHRFEEAKGKLKTLLATDPDNDMLKFYYGVSLSQTNNFEQSKEYLEQVYQGESIFKDEAAYYLALAYLGKKDKKNAEEWLKKIDRESGVYRKSRLLLKEIQ
ncbi:hypothetical protein Pedsa_0429 [Pseudopedobacter saltans DSM 12145]|uniref:Tetratricopeptide repeat protein n=1 Tax=Pseudopedobacter saltans (strain ATCC 51119 / DSM 12145 / JCM 21818 / CCUG 39354 / LMG 10337 / NBRC 100064 / NCIMB 13643) TaxID=762903 RepID=F0S5U0_PSESL|nr:hypothetical protein [Pseudopedobacter saltans]ADY51011.1 hypothetical protein Pedsa_0429 [Pseudopedobacter saltans DSM 12145]